MSLSFNQDRRSIKFILSELSNNPNLSEWEKGFIKSIKVHYLIDNKYLSKKQEQKLSDLWEKY